MSNKLVKRSVEHVERHETELVDLVKGVLQETLDAIALAESVGVSDYDMLKGLSPKLKEIGALGDVCSHQINWHNAIAAQGNKTMGAETLARDGVRDKD